MEMLPLIVPATRTSLLPLISPLMVTLWPICVISCSPLIAIMFLLIAPRALLIIYKIFRVDFLAVFGNRIMEVRSTGIAGLADRSNDFTLANITTFAGADIP